MFPLMCTVFFSFWKTETSAQCSIITVCISCCHCSIFQLIWLLSAPLEAAMWWDGTSVLKKKVSLVIQLMCYLARQPRFSLPFKSPIKWSRTHWGRKIYHPHTVRLTLTHTSAHFPSFNAACALSAILTFSFSLLSVGCSIYCYLSSCII